MALGAVLFLIYINEFGTYMNNCWPLDKPMTSLFARYLGVLHWMVILLKSYGIDV